MKRLFLLLALTLPMFAFAQEKGFDASVKAIAGIGIDDYENKSAGVEAIFGYRFNEHFRIGAGTGISWCDLLYEDAEISSSGHFYDEYREAEAFVPIFANGKYNILKRGISPYVSLNIGYSILIPFSDYAEHSKLGLMVNPAVGVDFPLSKGSLSLEIGYKYQDMSFDVADLYAWDINYSSLTLAVGYNF